MMVLAEKAQKIAIVLTKGRAETTIESLGVSLKSIIPDLIQAIMRAGSSNPSEVRRHLPGNAMRNLTVCKYIEENHMAIGQALTVSKGEWDVTWRIKLLLQVSASCPCQSPVWPSTPLQCSVDLSLIHI